MINASIDLLNYISKNTTNTANKTIQKEMSLNSTSNGESFKEVLDKKTNISAEKKEVVNKEDNNTITEIEDKLNKVTDAISNGDDEEINEAIQSILALLNINIVDNSKLPIVIEIPTDNMAEELSIINNISIEDYQLLNNEVNLQDINFLNNSNTDLKIENIDDDILLLLKQELGNDIPEEIIENIKTGIENILPLLATEDEGKVTKELLIDNIKSLLSNNGDDENKPTFNESLDKVNITKTTSKETVVTDNDENSSNFNNSKNSEEDKVTTSNEDKLLTKLISGDEGNFSSAMSRFETRASLIDKIPNEPVTVYKANMDQDIIKNIKFMVRNSVQELSVKIYPKELGEMTIKLLSEEGIMKAEIKAISKETYNLLNSNINEIKKALSNEDIKIQDVNIALYSEDTTYYSGQGFRENMNNGKNDNSQYFTGDSNSEFEEEETSINNQSEVNLLV